MARSIRAAVPLLILVVATASILTTPVRAQTPVGEWLVLGPVAAPDMAGNAAAESLPDGFLSLDENWPREGDGLEWFNGRTVSWTAEAPSGALTLAGEPGTVAFALTYLHADRWQKVTIEISGDGQQRAWLDGAPATGEVVLDQGSHWLLVQSQPSADGSWTLQADVQVETPGAQVAASASPARALTLTELEALPAVTSIEVDPTGRLGAFMIRTVDTENDRWVSALEIRDTQSGQTVRQLGLNTQASGPAWSRDGSKLAFLAPTDRQGGSGMDIWVWDLTQGEAQRIIRGEPGASGLQFSADGSWLYFTGSVQPDSTRNTIEGAARLTDVWERWSFWKSKTQLYGVHTGQGTRVTLAGDADYSVSGPELSPDGRRFVYGREVRMTERPFIRVELWELDLGTLQSRKIIDLDREAFAAPNSYAWSPDGEAVAFCASSANLLSGEDQEFNVFETELYAVAVESPELVSLTDQSIPSVGALGCNPDWSGDGYVSLQVQNGSRPMLARSSRAVSSGNLAGVTMDIVPLPAGEALGAYDLAGDVLVASVESPVMPQQVYRMNLADGASRLLFDPTEDRIAQADLPGFQEWTFTDSDGYEIDGWYLTPPDFDPNEEYPVVVWYYGGTVATSRNFDRRLAAYASQGYVVYVLNPAGAPGWGQEFSDLHVNDWGYPAGTDIIEGVTRFAEEHDFVDADRIGNFGHSYGGFMTMHMATRTDVFATSASLAGISNIANYWGSGWTGYSYTEGTCQGCYPWNRRDVYVERSPLFQADQIQTPLLLMHGTGDTNVVPTESEQMFTALRMLGRDTELIRFFGENHGINSKPSVQHNRDQILFEWFDMYLRDRPDAWRHRWKDEDGGPKRASAT